MGRSIVIALMIRKPSRHPTCNIVAPRFAVLSYDEQAHGIDIDTAFSWGGAAYQGSYWQGEDSEAIAQSVAQGFAIDGGNYSVFSQTVNDTGFWTAVNVVVTNGYQPARGNVVGSLVTNEVWDIMMSPDLLSGSIDNVGRFSLAALPSFTNDLAEIDPLVLDLDGDGIDLTPYNEGRVFFDIDNDGALERTGWVIGEGVLREWWTNSR